MKRLVTILAMAAFAASASLAFGGHDNTREALAAQWKDQVAAQKKIDKQDQERAKALAEKLKPENKKAER
jgi:hypothetical protein